MASNPMSSSSSSSSITVPADRISDLPEPLIAQILSSLTTKEAVATSILSRSWRFRWTHVTSFSFDNSSEESPQNQTMDFVDFIDRVLANHSGESVHKFLLNWKLGNFRPDYVNKWVDIAIGRNVRVLDLAAYGQTRQCEFQLPPSLYSHGILEVLKLTGPFRVNPPSEVSFPRLAEMALDSVIYESDESFRKLISASPILHCLSIERTTMRDDNLVVCVISSPALKTLFLNFLRGSLYLESEFKLKIDAPALKTLVLRDRFSSHISIEPRITSLGGVMFDPPISSSGEMIVELLKSFSSAVILSLSAVAVADMRAPLPRFERLGKLIIARPHMPFWSPLMDFLDGCIRLKELVVSLGKSRGMSWRYLYHVPSCLESSLRCLTLAGFNGGTEHMEMMKFFLMKCLRMRRVNIECAEEIHEKRFEILKKVSRLPRMSVACRFFLPDPSEIKDCFIFTDECFL